MKIALIENFGSDFYGARLRYALFLKEKGHHVIAVVPDDGYADKIRKHGIETIAIDIDVRKRNLSTTIKFSKKLKVIFKKEDFDIIHLYRMQPNLIGTAVAHFSSKKSKVINHITGLGVAFTKSSFKYKIMQTIIRSAYKINYSLFGATLIFQNEEDKKELGNKKGYLVVKGSSVNEERFNPSVSINSDLKKELNGYFDIENGITLIFVSRLLKQKGLSYLIEAIKVFNRSNEVTKLNLIIAGWIDPNNPDSFTEEEIQEFKKVERIAFLGRRNDIDQLIVLSDIVTLPTFYREGTPRFLLEGMAIGKPVLTTDMPGCNHLVKKGENGVLVKTKNTESLIDAFKKFSASDLKSMGDKSRLLYEQEFSEKIVFSQLLQSYIVK